MAGFSTMRGAGCFCGAGCFFGMLVPLFATGVLREVDEEVAFGVVRGVVRDVDRGSGTTGRGTGVGRGATERGAGVSCTTRDGVRTPRLLSRFAASSVMNFRVSVVG